MLLIITTSSSTVTSSPGLLEIVIRSDGALCDFEGKSEKKG